MAARSPSAAARGTQRVWDLRRTSCLRPTSCRTRWSLSSVDRQLRARGIYGTGWAGAGGRRAALSGSEAEESCGPMAWRSGGRIDGFPGVAGPRRWLWPSWTRGAWEPRTTLLGPLRPAGRRPRPRPGAFDLPLQLRSTFRPRKRNRLLRPADPARRPARSAGIDPGHHRKCGRLRLALKRGSMASPMPRPTHGRRSRRAQSTTLAERLGAEQGGQSAPIPEPWNGTPGRSSAVRRRGAHASDAALDTALLGLRVEERWRAFAAR